MENIEDLKTKLRIDIPGIFNEINIIRNHRKRFEQALSQEIILPPYEVIIHPCSQCNLCCKWCIGANVPTEEKETKEYIEQLPSTLKDPEKMERMIRNLLSYEKKVIWDDGDGEVYRIENFSFSGLVGEPLLAKEAMIKAIDILTESGRRVGIYTNATLIDEELINSLLKIAYVNISVDAGTPLTYSKLKYRGNFNEGRVLFYRVLENIKRLTETKRNSANSRLEVNVSFVLQPGNYKEIYEAAKLLKEARVSNLRMKQDNSGLNLLSEKEMEEASVFLDKIEDLKDENFNFIKIHLLNNRTEMKRTVKKCYINNLMASIGSDGKVYPCNYHPRPNALNYGDAITENFQSIWEGERRKVIKERLPAICPEVCDPFKNRANRLFEIVENYQLKNGKEKTRKLMDEMVKIVK